MTSQNVGGGSCEWLCRAVVLQGLPLKRKKTKTAVCVDFFQLLQRGKRGIYHCFFNRSHSEICLLKQRPPGASLCSTAACSEMGMAVGSARAHAFLWCSGSDSVVVLFLFSTTPKKTHQPRPEMTSLTAWALGTELSSIPVLCLPLFKCVCSLYIQ